MSKWVSTEEKDISWEHCGQPAYWDYPSEDADEQEVFCSKCQEMLVVACKHQELNPDECELCYEEYVMRERN